MYMRLIRREDRKRLGIGLHRIESPFFAQSKVESALRSPFSTLSLFDIDTTWPSGRPLTHQEIVKGVEEGTFLLVTDDPFSPLSEDTFNKYYHITGRGWPGSFAAPAEPEKPTPAKTEPVLRQKPKPQPEEPGFYIVMKSTTGERLKAALFAAQDPAVMSKFEALNPNLGNINAGTMIVLSDPNNLHCTREEAILMQAASKTNDAIKELSPEEADFMVRHREEFESFFAHASTSIGMGEAMFAKNLDDVKQLMKDIEALYVRTFEASGGLRTAEFFAERKRLLAQLNTNLTALTRKSIGFPDHPNLKSALGISSRSLVHRWTLAGGADQIPGYATHIEGVSRAAKYVKYGGWIGTAIGGGASVMKVQDVCAAGDAEACRKVKFTEAGGFVGGIAGGAAAGAALTGTTVGMACLAVGPPTVGIGTLICGVLVVGTGSLVGGLILGAAGEELGEVIYEHSK